ncbi:MAG: phosphatidylserine decarboxylase [Pseudomonadota bacterium]|nr:phosphatidylserine decarboxylase [Pseudomonadota bacterium]
MLVSPAHIGSSKLVSNYPHPILAREGWLHIALAVTAAVVLSFLHWWILAVPAWIIVVFVVQFFRDPPRKIPQQPSAVLCPADGRVLKVERGLDPFLNREALKISVFMNVFNVHSNRSPVDGNIVNAWYHAGAFVNASFDKASGENERNALHLRTASGQDVTCVQIAGLVARRILCYVSPGETLARGQRFGFIRFGSRVDVYLTPEARPMVAIGDVVKATETILAELPA